MNRLKTLVPEVVVVGFLLAGCAEPSSSTNYAKSAWQGGSVVNSSADDSNASSPETYRLPDLNREATLADLLACAALNNPGLEAAFNNWKAALEKVPQVKSLPDPKFTYRYFIEEVETRVGAQRQSFGITQTFPGFGKLELSGSAAEKAAKALCQQYEAAKLKLFYQVKETYYEYYYLWRAIAITEENIELLKHIESVARTRYKVGVGSHPDVIRTQVELGKIDDRLLSLREMREPIVARLNAALNRPVEDPLPWPAAIEQKKVYLTSNQLLAWLKQFNPELKALQYHIEESKTTIERAKRDYLPDVTLGADYIDTASSTGGRDPEDDGKDAVIATVSINLPIWWDGLSAGVRQARQLYRVALRHKEQRTNSLNVELKLVLYHFRDAERKVSLYQYVLLPKARESLKVTEASFRAGKGSLIDLIDAQRILLEFALTYERALANYAQRLAELEMLVGRELPRKTANDKPSHHENNGLSKE